MIFFKVVVVAVDDIAVLKVTTNIMFVCVSAVVISHNSLRVYGFCGSLSLEGVATFLMLRSCLPTVMVPASRIVEEDCRVDGETEVHLTKSRKGEKEVSSNVCYFFPPSL
ncbi:hypothetical protein, unlikely [Trypanosoma brucei gambiense DAL972]|uniref:Uncharacterized protein n=1 Tax=Trypanosoma brucei gambiense (strain MHOM/CI/86/DAL972) TaxID=679716 RepID=D0A7S6_TRYB9|nr:hypothetical protein, unlikely [Trypanosoma brucei gambiense DAL972]CBH17727.1 hypothetical protein, unlikely [Trypanosoma brucei gambiense DAL972]|eukprot:XP_011779991.1 hypothetical protein, unlikely [Trypanosoma brucei gambiense DAL972]